MTQRSGPKKRFHHRVTVSLDAETHDGLVRIAERNGVTVAWVVRQALAEVLARPENKQVKVDV